MTSRRLVMMVLFCLGGILTQEASAWYSPQLGRWLTRDPIEYEGDTNNLYEYVGGQIINAVDPSGTISPGGGGEPPGWCGKPNCKPGDEPPGRSWMPNPAPGPDFCGELTMNCKSGPRTYDVFGNSGAPRLPLLGGEGCITLPGGILCTGGCQEIKNWRSGDNPNKSILDHEACHACTLLDEGFLSYLGTAGPAPDYCCGNEVSSTPSW